jgi:hypothetical protein
MSEPVVSDEDFAAEPLLLPRLPGIPAPEFLSGRHADLAASPHVVAAQMVVVPAVWADVASAFATWRFLREPV